MTGEDTLHPVMRSALPGIFERVAKARRDATDTVQSIADDLVALDGFLAFEVGRLDLAIEKGEWSSRSDNEPLRKRRESLAAMRAMVDPERLNDNLRQLSSVVDLIRHLKNQS